MGVTRQNDTPRGELGEVTCRRIGTRAVAKLFHGKCEPYMERVAVSNEEFANLPSMKQVSTNFSY